MVLAHSQLKYDAMRDPHGLHGLRDLHAQVQRLTNVDDCEMRLIKMLVPHMLSSSSAPSLSSECAADDIYAIEEHLFGKESAAVRHGRCSVSDFHLFRLPVTSRMQALTLSPQAMHDHAPADMGHCEPDRE